MDNFYNAVSAIQSSANAAKEEANEKRDQAIELTEDKKRAREGVEVPLGMELLQMGLSSGRLGALGGHLANHAFSLANLKNLQSFDPESIARMASAGATDGFGGLVRAAADETTRAMRRSGYIINTAHNPFARSDVDVDEMASNLRDTYGSKEEAVEGIGGMLKRHFDKLLNRRKLPTGDDDWDDDARGADIRDTWDRATSGITGSSFSPSEYDPLASLSPYLNETVGTAGSLNNAGGSGSSGWGSMLRKFLPRTSKIPSSIEDFSAPFGEGLAHIPSSGLGSGYSDVLDDNDRGAAYVAERPPARSSVFGRFLKPRNIKFSNSSATDIVPKPSAALQAFASDPIVDGPKSFSTFQEEPAETATPSSFSLSDTLKSWFKPNPSAPRVGSTFALQNTGSVISAPDFSPNGDVRAYTGPHSSQDFLEPLGKDVSSDDVLNAVLKPQQQPRPPRPPAPDIDYTAMNKLVAARAFDDTGVFAEAAEEL